MPTFKEIPIQELEQIKKTQKERREKPMKLEYVLTPVASREFDSSPYLKLCLTKEDDFYGPYGVLNEFLKEVRSKGRAVVSGAFRTGKTSIMHIALNEYFANWEKVWLHPQVQISEMQKEIVKAHQGDTGAGLVIMMDELNGFLGKNWLELVSFLNSLPRSEFLILAAAAAPDARIGDLFPEVINMQPMTIKEAERYIRQSKNPKTDGQMFHPDLVNEFAQASQGHPFVLQNICDRAFMLARELPRWQGVVDKREFLVGLKVSVLDGISFGSYRIGGLRSYVKSSAWKGIEAWEK